MFVCLHFVGVGSLLSVWGVVSLCVLGGYLALAGCLV